MRAVAGRPVVMAARTGLTGRRVQTSVIGLVLLVSTAAATLALGLLVDSNAPFDHAFAAQRGSMKLAEEIDAMRTIGVSPMEALILPRVISTIILMPLLGFYASVIAIIGGGIIGLSTAMHLAQTSRASVVVLEAETDIAQHQTGHNSGVIHSGLTYFVVLMFRVPCAAWLLNHGCFFALGMSCSRCRCCSPR